MAEVDGGDHHLITTIPITMIHAEAKCVPIAVSMENAQLKKIVIKHYKSSL